MIKIKLYDKDYNEICKKEIRDINMVRPKEIDILNL